MACRCPVVSTGVGGSIDVIEHGHNGYIVPIGDSEALAARLIDVLTKEDMDWRKMSDAALATAQRNDWSNSVNRMEAALETCSVRAPRCETLGCGV